MQTPTQHLPSTAAAQPGASTVLSGSLGHLMGNQNLTPAIKQLVLDVMFGIADIRDVPVGMEVPVANQIVSDFPRFAAEQYVFRGEPIASVAYDLDQHVEDLTNASRLSAFASREFRVIVNPDDDASATIDAITEALTELFRIGFPPRMTKVQAGLPSGGLLIAGELGATIFTPKSRTTLEAIFS